MDRLAEVLWLDTHCGPGLGPVRFLWSVSAIVPVPVRSAANSCFVWPSPALATPRLFEPRPPRRRSTRWDAGRVLFPSIAPLWGKSPALHACGECLDLPPRTFDRRTLASASSSPSARCFERSCLCHGGSMWRQARLSCHSLRPRLRRSMGHCDALPVVLLAGARDTPSGAVLKAAGVEASGTWPAVDLAHGRLLGCAQGQGVASCVCLQPGQLPWQPTVAPPGREHRVAKLFRRRTWLERGRTSGSVTSTTALNWR